MAWDGRPETLKPINTLEELREFIATMPAKLLNQARWTNNGDCGTACCAAGWVHASHGWPIGTFSANFSARTLGLSDDEYMRIFYETRNDHGHKRRFLLAAIDRCLRSRAKRSSQTGAQSSGDSRAESQI